MKYSVLSLIVFWVICISMFSCREKHSDITNELILADSLLVQEQLQAASTIISNIEKRKKNDYENAYFALLKTKLEYLRYDDIKDCSLIDVAINFFKKTNDYHKLTNSYFYKAEILYTNEQYKEAIFAIKEAEYLANKLNDASLQHKVYMKLSFYNAQAREFEKALQYAKKESEYARLIHSDKELAYSYLSIANSYMDLNQKDSMRIYALKFVPLLNAIDNTEDLAFFYNCLGDALYEIDIEKAFSFYKKALDNYLIPQTCGALAEIYLSRGDSVNASKMIDEVLKCEIPEPKIKLLERLSSSAVKNNDAKLVYKFMSEIIKEKDLRNEDFINDKTLNFQHIAEIQKETEIWHLKIYIISIIAVVIFFISIVYVIYSKLKKVKKDKTISEYQLHIKELQSKINANANTVEVKKQLEKQLEKYMLPFKRGKELFYGIECGGNFGKWTNNDFIEYINYCKLEYFSFLTSLNEFYDNLSPLQIVYLLQKEMHINDDLIADRLVIDKNSLASYRSRIEKKRKKSITIR